MKKGFKLSFTILLGVVIFCEFWFLLNNISNMINHMAYLSEYAGGYAMSIITSVFPSILFNLSVIAIAILAIICIWQKKQSNKTDSIDI